MANPSFEPEKALGKKLTEMDKQELCAFISDLCSTVVAEVGSRGRRGGIYPDNISVNDNGEIAVGPAGKGPGRGRSWTSSRPSSTGTVSSPPRPTCMPWGFSCITP